MREVYVQDLGSAYIVHAVRCPIGRKERAAQSGYGAAKFPAGLERHELAAELLADALAEGQIRLRDYHEWVRFPDCCEEERDGNGSNWDAGAARDAESAGDGRSTRSSRSSGSDPGGGGNRPAPGGKPDLFAADAKAAGWDPVITADGEFRTVVATRGDEKISITWKGEACQNGCFYQNAGYKRSLRNAAACRRQLTVPAGEVRIPAPTKRVRPRAAISEPDSDPYEESPEDANEYRRYLPFDPADEAETILAALRGREITWRSSITKGLASAVLMPNEDQRHLRIEDHPHKPKRILTFASRGAGFRSVYIDSIVAVS